MGYKPYELLVFYERLLTPMALITVLVFIAIFCCSMMLLLEAWSCGDGGVDQQYPGVRGRDAIESQFENRRCMAKRMKLEI